MRMHHVDYLACPRCKSRLKIHEIKKGNRDSIEEGVLLCTNCFETFQISRYVPRFVSLENYAKGFGIEWTLHARTQHDNYTNTDISEKRFFNETKWPKQLNGELILEVGSGSGRFTEQAASTGAMVVSVDYSRAADANYALNGHHTNVLIAQADVYNLPVREGFFDRIFCFGVLQHTPNPKRAFMILPRFLKNGGHLAIDVYQNRGWKGMLETKYWVRPVSKRIEPIVLYSLCKQYVEIMWHLTSRIPKCLGGFGRQMSSALLVADYTGVYDLPPRIAREWAILEIFDVLSPRYDYPQTLEAVQKWFQEANLANCDVGCGYNGIYGRATKQLVKTE